VLTDAPSSSQLILGIDKRNPLFAVYQDHQQERLHVYYGFDLLEIVPDDREAPALKMLAGRLYNAGLKVQSLTEVFEVDRKTLQRWGRALQSGDAQQLIQVLAGRSAARKLTPTIEAFVRQRWPQLTAQGHYRSTQRLRQEIQQIFRVKLSAETLRPLVRELKAGTSTVASEGQPEGKATPAPVTSAMPVETRSPALEVAIEKRETPCDCAGIQPEGDGSLNPLAIQALAPVGLLRDNPKESPVFLGPAPARHVWCDHAGVLLFAQALNQVRAVVQPPQPLLGQWSATLLLGAVNIEQTKFLNWQDLELILGTVVRFPAPQRELLKSAATEATIEALFRFNAQGLFQGDDFYFDPHTEHYTGQQNVLKGWCPAVRLADKALHSDFVHTVRGEPIYFETTDNFEDLRQRFFAVMGRCRRVHGWAAERVITTVVDRGIFGGEVFEKVLANPLLHLITWEKGYVAQNWDPKAVQGQLVIERARNASDDLRSYHFEYLDRDWPTDPRLRQLVVRATNPQGRVAQVSILTDDRVRAAEEGIRLIFNRWIQENDFKYLDKHYGINQLTSYRVIPYEQLKGQVTDREVISGQGQALRQERKILRQQQARWLLVQEKCDHADGQRQKQLAELELRQSQASEASPSMRPQIAKLQKAHQQYEQKSQTRREQIRKWSSKLAELEEQAAQHQTKVSRLDTMIAANMVRMEPECKRLMDTLRITVRNLFYRALAPFKKAYDNYRDDHDYFRQLTLSSGVLEMGAERITVHLMPKVNYSPQLQRIIGQLLEQVNQQELQMPDGTARKLRFRLGHKSELELSIHPKSACVEPVA
jgi:transposase